VNLHFHTLVLDGVLTEEPGGALAFHPAPAPTDAEVAAALATIRHRVQRLLVRRGLEPADDATSPADRLADESPVLAGIVGASVQGRVALGSRAGARVRRLGDACDTAAVTSRGPRQAHLEGFDLHANVWVSANDRAGVERLCRLCGAPHTAVTCSGRRWPRTASGAWPTGACGWRSSEPGAMGRHTALVHERLRVRPGLTGIAQIYASRDVPQRDKFRYDRLYIRRQSFSLDLKLIFLPFWITFRGAWERRGGVLSLPVPVAREPLSEGSGSAFRSPLLAAPWTRRPLVLLLALALAGVLVPLGAGQLGRRLVVADPLKRTQAMVVLSGWVPFRAMEAASVYQAGWAPEVLLTKETRTPEELALDRLGVPVVRGEAYNREVLERLGVPARAIRLLDDGVWNTTDEVGLVARELAPGGADRVILRPLRERGAVRRRAVVATHQGGARSVTGGVRTDKRVGGLPGAAGSRSEVIEIRQAPPERIAWAV
jgi:Bacterial sugar transferase/Putative transposase